NRAVYFARFDTTVHPPIKHRLPNDGGDDRGLAGPDHGVESSTLGCPGEHHGLAEPAGGPAESGHGAAELASRERCRDCGGPRESPESDQQPVESAEPDAAGPVERTSRTGDADDVVRQHGVGNHHRPPPGDAASADAPSTEPGPGDVARTAGPARDPTAHAGRRAVSER